MTAFVALATDANPSYAIYAPIVVRLWERLGYTPIVVRHDSGWNTPLGRLVTEELSRRGEGTNTVLCARVEPLSIGNTMRVSRLAVAAHPLLRPDDMVLTADIDMAPLSRTWFELPKRHTMIVLRADMYGSLPGASALMPDGSKALICGLFRFPLCYVGLTKAVWFEILPLVGDDRIEKSIRRVLHGLRHDAVDYDEATCSARLLLSHRCVGALLESTGDLWWQGELALAPMTDWPRGQPKHMLLGGMANTAHPIPSAIDFHMPKPAPDWIGRVLSMYWPEEADFLADYWPRALKARDSGA